MGILWFTACQPAKGTQTGYGSMPAMSQQGKDGCKECALDKRLEQLPDGYATSAGDGECFPSASAGSPGTRDEIFSGNQNQFHLECIMEKALLVEGHEGYSTAHLRYQFTTFLYVKEKPV